MFITDEHVVFSLLNTDARAFDRSLADRIQNFPTADVDVRIGDEQCGVDAVRQFICRNDFELFPRFDDDNGPKGEISGGRRNTSR